MHEENSNEKNIKMRIKLIDREHSVFAELLFLKLNVKYEYCIFFFSINSGLRCTNICDLY